MISTTILLIGVPNLMKTLLVDVGLRYPFVKMSSWRSCAQVYLATVGISGGLRVGRERR